MVAGTIYRVDAASSFEGASLVRGWRGIGSARGPARSERALLRNYLSRRGPRLGHPLSLRLRRRIHHAPQLRGRARPPSRLDTDRGVRRRPLWHDARSAAAGWVSDRDDLSDRRRRRRDHPPRVPVDRWRRAGRSRAGRGPRSVWSDARRAVLGPLRHHLSLRSGRDRDDAVDISFERSGGGSGHRPRRDRRRLLRHHFLRRGGQQRHGL